MRCPSFTANLHATSPCFLCPAQSHLLCKPTPSLVQGGDTYAGGFGITILIPKNFLHQSFEAEETAKELTIKAAKEKAAAEAKTEAKDETKKAEQNAVKQAGTKQKIKKQAATEKQKAAAAPTKEDAAVKRCTVSFPGARFVLVSVALFFAATMALRSNSSMPTGAAEVVTTKFVSSCADASNDQQCLMHDNDNGVRNNFTTVQEAKGFAHTASLDPTAMERTGLRVEKEEGVACQPWWLPVMLGVHDAVLSGNLVVVTTHDGGDVDDGTPHHDLTSHQSAEQPTPADIRAHAPPASASFDPVRPVSFIAIGREMVAWWTSSALMCALLFLLSAYVFNGKVATLLSSCTQLALLFALRPANTLHLAPRCTLLFAFRTMAAGPGA